MATTGMDNGSAFMTRYAAEIKMEEERARANFEFQKAMYEKNLKQQQAKQQMMAAAFGTVVSSTGAWNTTVMGLPIPETPTTMSSATPFSLSELNEAEAFISELAEPPSPHDERGRQ